MATRLPYDEWLATQSAEQLRARALKQKSRVPKATKKAKPVASGRTTTRRKKPGVTARGRGPYAVSGGIEGSFLGQKYNLGGKYYTNDYDPRKSGSVKGYGEYKVRQNSIMHLLDLGTSPPRVLNTTKGEAVVISHREYLGDLTSGGISFGGNATDFTLTTYPCNPGNSQLFAFLGSIAHKFQEYEIRGMLVELKTLSSDYAANLSLGSMFAAADYNSLATPPVSKLQLENMEYASSCKPSTSLIMPIECEPRNNSNQHLYVADDLDYEGGDKRLFDLCNIFIGSQGIPTAYTPIAEIWITYEVALFKPVILPRYITPGPLSYFQSAYQDVGVTYPFGRVVNIVEGNTTLYNITDRVVTLPPIKGNYVIVVNWQSANPAIMSTTGGVSATTGPVEQLLQFWSNASNFIEEPALLNVFSSNIAATTQCYVTQFRVSEDVACTIEFNLQAEQGSNVDVFITNYSPLITHGQPPVLTMKEKRKKEKKERKVALTPSRPSSSQYDKDALILELQRQLADKASY